MTARSDREDGPTVENRSTGRNPGSVIGWVIGIIVVIALIILAVFASDVWGADGDEEIADIGVNVFDVQEDTAEYLGQRVTVSGEVNEVIDPQSFTIGGHEFLGGTLLIVSVEPIPIPAGVEREGIISPDDIVQVTGTVHILSDALLDEVGEEYGFLTEEGTAYAEHQGDPVIIIDSINLTPRASEP